MTGAESLGLASTQLHLACGRIASGARAVAEAHRFGVPEGPHDELWTAEYHRAAVHVYGDSLPRSYQRDIASLFSHGVDTLAEMTSPTLLAEDCLIVGGYMRNACAAIVSWLDAEPGRFEAPEPAEPPEIDDHTPVVIHFDRLAALATRAGAGRLEQAAVAVQHHVGAPPAPALDNDLQRLLQGVASEGRLSIWLPSSATRAARCTGNCPSCGRPSACRTGLTPSARPPRRACSTEPPSPLLRAG